MTSFAELLRNYGYWDVCRLHRDRHIDRRYLHFIKENRDALSPQTQTLVDLFICDREVAEARLAFVPPGLLAQLIDEGILVYERAGVLRSRFHINVVDNQFILTEDLSDPDASVYFGEDSEFFASMLDISPGARCLDLCTGTAVQALVSLSRGAASVDAVDVNPRAIRVSELNGRLNGVADRMRLYLGDLFSILPPDRAYDRITCNPPLLPIPDGVPYSLSGDGGADGLEFTRVILAELGRRLTDEGKCMLLGLSPATSISNIEILCREMCRAPLQYTLYLLARQSVDDYSKQVALTICNLYPEENIVRLRRRLREAFSDLGVVSVVSYYLSIRKVNGSVPSGTYDLTRNNMSPNYWFVGGQR